MDCGVPFYTIVIKAASVVRVTPAALAAICIISMGRTCRRPVLLGWDTICSLNDLLKVLIILDGWKGGVEIIMIVFFFD